MTEETTTRKLTAILSADVKDYSRLMSQDERGTIRTLTTYKEAMSHLIQDYKGRVIDSPGDNLLAEFGSVVDAVNCTVEIQRDLGERNAALPPARQMKFRIGINLGDVVEEEGRIYGDGVNIAARLESLAEGGGICISGTVFDQIEDKLGLECESLGEQSVKNIKKPVRVYKVRMERSSSDGETSQELPLPDKPSIAVLPFVNMSGDPEQEYFSDGITEDIITSLSRSPWLFVIARNSSFSYRGKPMDVKTVSKELGVRHILEGSIRKSGNRLRVTAQLVDGIRGNHVWAEKYDGELHDIFDFQDEITRQIVASTCTEIQLDIGHSVYRLKRADVRTWDLLARGWRLFYELTIESLADAEILFRKAVALDPSSSEASFLLAGVLIHQVHMDFSSDKEAIIAEAYELAKSALILEDRHEYAHWVMGMIELYRSNHQKSIAEFERAIELNPNCSLSYGSLGTVLSYSGEIEKSIKNNLIAIRLNPKDISIFFRFGGIAMAHYVGARYSEAEDWARKGVYRKPNYQVTHAVLAASLAQLDRLKEAQEAVHNYLELFPNASISRLLDLLPFKYSADALKMKEGLRKAGLPE